MALTKQHKLEILNYMLPNGSFSDGILEDSEEGGVGDAYEQGAVTDDDICDFINLVKATAIKHLKLEIPVQFNIWDDYYDDGHVPAGQIQKTRGYVESDHSETEKEEVAELVCNFILGCGVDLCGAKVEACGEDVDFEHMTHVVREILVKKLQASGLNYKGQKIQFYSES